MTIGEILAACFGGASLLIVVVEKLFGGGNALAAKFHSLDKSTATTTEKLRDEMMRRIDVMDGKVDHTQSNYRVGLDAVTANIHALREGLLELRAKMAEEYIAKGGLDEIKQDMRRGFEAVDKRIGEMQDLIMYVNPDTPKSRPPR